MTKRRSIIAAFLVVALLTVGVGFAAVSDYLTVGGTIEASKTGAESQFDLDVYFLDPVNTLDDNVTVTLGTDKDSATIDVPNSTALAHVGDDIDIVLPIVNDSVYDATLTIEDNGAHTAFTVTYTLWAEEGCTTSVTEVASASTVYLKVNIKVAGDPTVSDLLENLNMKLTATSK